MTRIYVVVEDSGTDKLGYHAVNVGQMNVDALARRPRGAPDHGELPILFLGQVAVSTGHQGRGLGSILMHHVFLKAVRLAEEVGCYALVLDVMSNGSLADFERRGQWYAEFGFQAFASSPARMFMTIRQIRALTTAKS